MRDTVDATCKIVGRDPATLGRTLAIGVAVGERTIEGADPLTGSPEQIAAALRGFAQEGIDHVQVWLNPSTFEGIAQLGSALAVLDQG
jgi:hypothetical protein